ncbi:MAG: hypothetical protein SVO01_00010 [Thermotogota bacterium]|nr:hypothetical protein [Thermotogota bacterium]
MKIKIQLFWYWLKVIFYLIKYIHKGYYHHHIIVGFDAGVTPKGLYKRKVFHAIQGLESIETFWEEF